MIRLFSYIFSQYITTLMFLWLWLPIFLMTWECIRRIVYKKEVTVALILTAISFILLMAFFVIFGNNALNNYHYGADHKFGINIYEDIFVIGTIVLVIILMFVVGAILYEGEVFGFILLSMPGIFLFLLFCLDCLNASLHYMHWQDYVSHEVRSIENGCQISYNIKQTGFNDKNLLSVSFIRDGKMQDSEYITIVGIRPFKVINVDNISKIHPPLLENLDRHDMNVDSNDDKSVYYIAHIDYYSKFDSNKKHGDIIITPDDFYDLHNFFLKRGDSNNRLLKLIAG